MNIRRRQTALALALGGLVLLAGCAAPASTDEPAGPDAPVEEAPVEETVATACPAGFVDAFVTAATPDYSGDLEVREITAEEFQPDFLVPLLDGACAIEVSGTQSMTGVQMNATYGITADAASGEAVKAELLAAGYQELDEYNFQGDGFAGIYPIGQGGASFVIGQEALEQFFSGGVIFYA